MYLFEENTWILANLLEINASTGAMMILVAISLVHDGI